MIELWPFQKTLIQALRETLLSGHTTALLVSPTGSGKTVMFAYLTGKLSTAGKRTVILAHRKELLDQISATLKDFQVQHDLIGPGSRYNALYPVHVASVFSVVRKLGYVEAPDYVIIDEAHHAIPGSTWNKTLDCWRAANPKLRIIGVTATPERLSGEGLDHTFDTMIMGPSVAQLIQNKYLSPYKMFAPPRAVDISGLHRRMGDFIRGEAAELMDKPKITGDAITHYKKHLNGAPMVSFCVSVEHAYHVAEQYRAQGWKAVAIEGKLSAADRKERVDDFAAGRLNVLTSCDLISEGYDVPGMMGCQNLRPTESLALCLQQWGRTLRYQDGKTAIILDHVGNSTRHGLPDQDREWSLVGRESNNRRTSDPDDIAIRQCRMCGAVQAAIRRTCSECGAEFVIKVRKIEEVEGTLEEIRAHEKAKYMNSKAAEKRLAALTNLGRMRGYNNPAGWAGHVLSAVAEKEVKKRIR
jgi:superfamily II DNA or RNA helicase